MNTINVINAIFTQSCQMVRILIFWPIFLESTLQDNDFAGTVGAVGGLNDTPFKIQKFVPYDLKDNILTLV